MHLTMNVLHVNTADRGGGAEGSARRLFGRLRERGLGSWLAVGRKLTDDPDVFEIPIAPSAHAPGRWLQRLAGVIRRQTGRLPGALRLARICDRLASGDRLRNWWEGAEDFAFPGSHQLLQLPPALPDIVHCHNLHGWYFDLESLVELSRRVPVIVNLRDAWLLTGHCAYFFECRRWRTGCGQCPDLRVYPAIRRDRTAENWARKARIYRESRLHVTVPSTWLLECVKASMLVPASLRLIPNGIDLAAFTPGDRAAARRKLGVPQDARIVLAAANNARRSRFKDIETTRSAVAEAAGRLGQDVSLYCLGGGHRVTMAGHLQVREIPFIRDPRRLALYYRAADVVAHAAHAEAFGKVITEAMACGTPVVATAVGGIPDQVSDGANGFLVPRADAAAMGDRLGMLLMDRELRDRLGAQAGRDATRFSLETQAERFLDWYREIIAETDGES